MSEGEHNADRHRMRQLIGIGMLSVGLVLLIALLSRRFAITILSAQRPHLLMWGLFTLLFGTYLVALRLATRITDSSSLLKVICLFAVAFRGILLLTTPIQEIDLYRYIWDGNVLAAGVDPYRFSPRNVIDASAQVATDESAGDFARAGAPLPRGPLRQLSEIERRSPALGQILRTTHYAELPTLYPPVSQAMFALAAVTTPDRATVSTHLIVMKAWIVLFDLLTLVMMIALLKSAGIPVGWCLAYAWCPLVLKEFANSGHLDAIAVFLTTASLWLLIEVPRQRGMCRLLASAGLLGLGMGAKLYPVVLLPIVLVWLVRQQSWRASGLFVLITTGVGSLALWPMLGIDRSAESAALPPSSIDVDHGPARPALHPHSSFSLGASPLAISQSSGLGAFLTRWEMNDFLFLIINENLDPSAPRSRQPWFAIVPDSLRMAIVSPLMDARNIGAASAAFQLSRALTLGIFGLLTIWWAWRLWMSHEPVVPAVGGRVSREADGPAATTGPSLRSRPGHPPAELRLLETAFLALAWFWLLAPTQNPWYWTWCLPLLPFARSRAWLWVSGLVMAYYLRFWLNAHWPEPPGPLGSRHDGASLFDFILVWVEYVPLFCGLLVSRLLRRRGGEQ